MLHTFQSWSQVQAAIQIFQNKGGHGVWAAARFRDENGFFGDFLFSISSPPVFTQLTGLNRLQGRDRWGLANGIGQYLGADRHLLVSGMHAEEYLISEIRENRAAELARAAQLVILISDSPCTSADGARASVARPPYNVASCTRKLDAFADELFQVHRLLVSPFYVQAWGNFGANNITAVNAINNSNFRIRHWSQPLHLAFSDD